MNDQHSSAANLRQFREACYAEISRARIEGREPVQPSLDFLSASSRAQLAAALARRERRAQRRMG